MLAFPRYFDSMFEMKKPHLAGHYFDEDFDEDFSPFRNHSASPQFKQSGRIPVPVHHEPTFQQQRQQQRQFQPRHMPVPQPTGDTQQLNRHTTPTGDESEIRVRSPTQIRVRHVPIVHQSGVPVTPPEYSRMERMVPVRTEQAPRRGESPIEMETSLENSSMGVRPSSLKSPKAKVHKKPAFRKRTSLVVSDDHITPIPMPYEHLEGAESIMEEEDSQEEKGDGASDGNSPTSTKHQPLRKQTSLIVSEDRKTPIPMPYEHLKNAQSQIEEESGEDEVAGSSDDDKSLEARVPSPLPKMHQQWEVKEESESSPRKVIPIRIVKTSAPEEKDDASKTSTASVTLSPRMLRKKISRSISPEARDVPITVQGQHSTRSYQPQMSERLAPTAVNAREMPMPQPQPTGSAPAAGATGSSESFTKPGDTYTQPKPPAPKPKQQWVDPRITASLETIDKIDAEAQAIGKQVDGLQVTSKDQTYLAIEEQLTKLLLKLDSIESFGDDGVRSKRKACIRQVQQTLDTLELKLDFS